MQMLSDDMEEVVNKVPMPDLNKHLIRKLLFKERTQRNVDWDVTAAEEIDAIMEESDLPQKIEAVENDNGGLDDSI